MNSIDDNNLRAESDDNEYTFIHHGKYGWDDKCVSWRDLCVNAY